MEAFAHLQQDDLLQMCHEFHMRRTAPNEIIYEQGTEHDCFYVIASGTFEQSASLAPGSPRMQLSLLTTGSSFGENGLLGTMHSNVTITSIETGWGMTRGD